jgi:hypothetical protein
MEGRIAIVTDAGRDAVDAGSAFDEGAGLRTAKSCGPDVPTLASSWWKRFRWRWWQTSPVTKESAKETVKTIAQGMPDDSGEPVVSNSCAFYFAHEAAGATGARHSLCPPFGAKAFMQQLGRIARRDRGDISCRHREERSDEAIQSCFHVAVWIASLRSQ